MTKLVFRALDWRQLRERLLSASPLEHAAVLVVSSGRGDESDRLVVRDIVYATPEDILEQTPVRVTLSPTFLAAQLKAARGEKSGLILVHTHPGQDEPVFSDVDDRAQLCLAPTLHRRSPEGRHGFLVIGAQGYSGRLFDASGQTVSSIDSVHEVGSFLHVFQAGQAGEVVEETLPAHFDRNVRAFGREGQKRLQALTVAIVGVGGTGSIVVEELARLGVGRLILIDPETLEDTNLNRVFGSSPADIGRLKIDVAADAALRANPAVQVKLSSGSVIEERTARSLLDADFVLCCTDSHGSRAVLNQISYQYRLPMIDVGVRIDANEGVVTAMSTRVQMLAEGLPCLNCHPLLDPVSVRRDLQLDTSIDPYIVGHYEPQPAVVSLNAQTSSSAVSMFLSAVTGYPGNSRHLVGRPIDGVVRAVASAPNLDCVVCSHENTLARADGWPMIWRAS